MLKRYLCAHVGFLTCTGNMTLNESVPRCWLTCHCTSTSDKSFPQRFVTLVFLSSKIYAHYVLLSGRILIVQLAHLSLVLTIILVLEDGRRSARFLLVAYHNKIGDYFTSAFYTKFLSDSVVHNPGQCDATVCKFTRQQSSDPKGTFCSWFCIALYKVKQISTRVLLEKILTLSHHSHLNEKLQIKYKLLVLGLLAVLSCVYKQFCQIPTYQLLCSQTQKILPTLCPVLVQHSSICKGMRKRYYQ
jgi:hypothetical protein